MDEPQEGMDTENSQKWLEKLNPLFKFRYSATHAVKKNVLYQLTPAESCRLGLVKKLEVLTVAESNDEATLKMELSSVQATNAAQPKVKLKLWKLNGTKTACICVDNKLEDATVDYFMEHTDTKFICIERALDSTEKFNLKKKMGDKFYAF